MIAASVWSLLMPSIDMAKEQNIISWLPATIGFILGIIFLLVLDNIIPHLHVKSSEPEGLKSKLGKTAMMVLAVTLHRKSEETEAEKAKYTEEKAEEGSYLLRERRYGNYSRTYYVGDDVKFKNISAKLDNGVLTLTIQKAKEEEKEDQYVEIQ